MTTGKEMCEYIVKAFPNISKSPKELWEDSSDGSLTHVMELYCTAREQNRLPAFEDSEMQSLYESFLRTKSKRR